MSIVIPEDIVQSARLTATAPVISAQEATRREARDYATYIRDY